MRPERACKETNVLDAIGWQPFDGPAGPDLAPRHRPGLVGAGTSRGAARRKRKTRGFRASKDTSGSWGYYTPPALGVLTKS